MKIKAGFKSSKQSIVRGTKKKKKEKRKKKKKNTCRNADLCLSK